MRAPSLLVLAAALLTTAAPPAFANGKFPAAGQIVVHPSDPANIFVRTTFGILVSRDAGASFDWICESGAGYAGNVDPGIAVTETGTLLAGIVDGLDVGRGDACGWEIAGGSIAGRAIADVSVVKSAPTSAVALAVDPMGNIVFRTDDDAVTWAPSGVAIKGTFQGITLDVAPSDPARIYVSGLDASMAVKAVLARTNDMGGSWEIRPIPEASGRAPYIAAVDPNDADTVYVRLDGTPGTLLVTRDGGATWQSVFSIPGYIQAFALSPDGTTVLAGGPTDGLWRAPASTLVFERISSAGVQCLSWAHDSVYACGTSYAVGRSKSAGEAIEPLLRLPCIRGPLACDAMTSVGSSCPGEWPALMIKIGSMYCDQGVGGAGGAGGSERDAGAGGGGVGGGGEGMSPTGCGCRAGGESIDRGSLFWLVAALSMVATLRHGERRSRDRRPGTIRSIDSRR